MPLLISALVPSLALLPDVCAQIHRWLVLVQATPHQLAVVPLFLGVRRAVAHCRHHEIAAVHQHGEMGVADLPMVFVPEIAPLLVPNSGQRGPLHSRSELAVVVHAVLELCGSAALAARHVMSASVLQPLPVDLRLTFTCIASKSSSISACEAAFISGAAGNP